MRKQLSFASIKKSTHIRRRYSHNVSRPQLTQENVNIDIQGSQSTLSENIQDDYNDDMDFQYDNRSEELPTDEDKESSKEDENEESSEDENEESSEIGNEESSEDENEESSGVENEESSEDENEELSEDENEESLEDENEEFLEDENNEDELSEDVEEYDNTIYELSEDEEECDNIIDEALGENEMPSYDNNNEFAPYFENFTTATLFCWLQKHNISTNAYEDLAEIIHNPQFMPTHVIKNIWRFRQWRKHLPLLSISERSISISSKKTPSTSKNSKMSYQLSINDIIWHVLNNPSLMRHMYFGPGIDSEIKSEYWHGELWGESPFYGQEKINILQG
jgi:hypothetical protein